MSSTRRFILAIARALFLGSAVIISGTACGVIDDLLRGSATIVDDVPEAAMPALDDLVDVAVPAIDDAVDAAAPAIDDAVESVLPAVDNLSIAGVPAADVVIREATRTELDWYITIQVADLKGRIEDVLGRFLTSEEITGLRNVVEEAICSTLDISKELAAAEIKDRLPDSLAAIDGVDQGVLNIANFGSEQLRAMAVDNGVEGVAIAIEIGCGLGD